MRYVQEVLMSLSNDTDANISRRSRQGGHSDASRPLEAKQPVLSGPRLLTMTIAAAAGVANLFYNQPLLEQMTADLHSGSNAVGFVPTMTQIGYSLGMLLLVPLGDMLQRRRLTLLFVLLAACMSIGTAVSVSAPMLLTFSFLLGLVNVAPQLLIPFAAQLSAPAERGRVVGFMLSGVFLGVLLSRTVAGFVGAAYGWRTMFYATAGLHLILLLALSRSLPVTEPTYRGEYLGLLRSVVTLLAEQPVLRETCLFGATLFGAFMVFWSSLIHLIVAAPFHLGPRTVGLYGVLGAGAALLSPVIGKFTDRGNARSVTGAMIVLTIGSFGIFWLGRASLLWIGVGVLAMDLGVQLAHVSNQGRIMRLVADAHSRIQTAYMTSYFAGGGVGAAVGSWAWGKWGWAGVCVAAVAILMLPLVRYLLPLRTIAHGKRHGSTV
jgi:predicted MFS family arabinose efflux permease